MSNALQRDPLLLDALDRISQLETQITTLLRRQAPRDHADEALLLAIVESTAGQTFSAQSLWRHRRVDERLRLALESADIDGPRSLAALLKRCRTGSIVAVKAGRTRAGAAWRMRFSDSCEAHPTAVND